MRKLLLLATPLLMAPLPKGAIEYESDGWTQSIFTFYFTERVIRPLKIAEKLDAKWHQSGGMEGIKGVVSRKYKTLPSPVVQRLDFIEVEFNDSAGEKRKQKELGIVRSYPNGTRFDDMLYFNDILFEHRVREKKDGIWDSYIESREILARPPGYNGLKASCASCHNQAGTGLYGVGLVPGGDTVLSDPFDWSMAKTYFK
jgi:hypothetical protein